MTKLPAPRDFRPAWQPMWSKKRMRLELYFLHGNEGDLRSIFTEMENRDYRFRHIKPILTGEYFIMCITKLGHFSEATMDAEIQEALDVCHRHGIQAMDEAHLADPDKDDRSVN
ncbi:MAG: hypothetical protein IPH05_15275 [Flavobacteriales bacterium]|jgi:hypothetical protein|nr:hypothetical protein [Flavobacteriales bacterium]MBK6884270.1 hypothetical protein [Flavobacteriales bacterium]MBK7100659.1 hypothetical protein [Flavobacteriales bacterium]MBK7111356.1 hypothetical protein [Flavobacteriales bacterium]MBK8707507.1 hypothetical protein [Flavobacteriales bacterium]